MQGPMSAPRPAEAIDSESHSSSADVKKYLKPWDLVHGKMM